MTWSTFWTEYNHLIGWISDFFTSFPPIIVSMVTAPLLFAVMYGFVKMVRGLRS